MADILIRGMDMPTEQRMEVIIFKNGFVAYYDVYGRYIGQAKAAPLPEGHGELIEKKSAKAKFCQFCFWKHQNKDACERCAGCPIDFIPTIVPAEGGTDDG